MVIECIEEGEHSENHTVCIKGGKDTGKIEGGKVKKYREGRLKCDSRELGCP